MTALKLVLAILIFSLVSPAAPWDGAKGPLTVVTFTFSSGTGATTPGVPVVPGPLVWHTTLFIKCTDPAVTAVRVRLSYRDSTGDHFFVQIADFASGFGGVTLSVTPEQITSAVFTELRDGATY
jgi:hypothetical protein